MSDSPRAIHCAVNLIIHDLLISFVIQVAKIFGSSSCSAQNYHLLRNVQWHKHNMDNTRHDAGHLEC